MPSVTPADVRQDLLRALRLDLIGPDQDSEEHYAEEILTQAPSKWYLNGFLVPYEASATDRSDPLGDDLIDELSRPSPGDDEQPPESASARKALFPSSMGLSFLVPQTTKTLAVTIQWGDYSPLENEAEVAQAETRLQSFTSRRWQRKPRHSYVEVSLESKKSQTQLDLLANASDDLAAQLDLPIDAAMINKRLAVPDSGGLELVLSMRPVGCNGALPVGTRSVSIFLVNQRKPSADIDRDMGYIFQAQLTVHADGPFVPRPDMRGQNIDDEDEQIADLQYRNDFEYAVGHNVSATALMTDAGGCHQIQTNWMPTADVEKVIASKIDDVNLSMEALGNATDAATIRAMVGNMVTAYGDWIAKQQVAAPKSPPQRAEVSQKLLHQATQVNQRIHAGLQALDDPDVLEAFKIANRAIASAIRQRSTHDKEDKLPEDLDPPEWRPFQLAFLLMNMVGIATPEHYDRTIVDLLFFPTGGGKTEAYLGLAAFTLVLRRLRNPGIQSAGLSVLMRYTLRLLTLDQLGRASTLICALELERQQDIEKLGKWPFEIGLWVGSTATPNIMGQKGDKKDYSARARTIAYQNNANKPCPIPLDNCPWCGTQFNRKSFQLWPTPDRPTDLRITCINLKKRPDGKPVCEFRRDQALPIVAVDEPIYRRLPCFIIATVDKFANLPWVGDTGALFGKVERFDSAGFYGPTAKGFGQPLASPLPPPDLIIQDELHLISGPLGTMVGLYETAVDHLASYELNGKTIHPKIIASTATVRRATSQIRALFGRDTVEIFPPPGPDRRHSFFSETVPVKERHGRTYVGVAAQGRSLKVVLLRTYLALMAAAQKAWEANGGAKNLDNPADPYMTLLGYFNSLRELGGSRRIVEDEVKARLEDYGKRRRESEPKSLFADRTIAYEPLELTSRVNTSEVAESKGRIAKTFHNKDRVDVVLATNMISVGLDITRLGLMVVLGQPKTAAEYIQTTSRVGRDDERPGLVVTLLNVHRPRDRSHYERFQAWHNTFYRAVEATSVTPFSPRALDRGLAAVTVALARLGYESMTAPERAVQITHYREHLNFVVDTLAERAQKHDRSLDDQAANELRQKLRGRVLDLLDSWEHIANDKGMLQYQQEIGTSPPLLFDPLDPDLEKQPKIARKFKAQRSLRDVEPTVNLWVKTLDGLDIEEDDES